MLLKWPDLTFPPINLYVMARLEPNFEAKIEKTGRKSVNNQPDFSILYKKRNEG